MKIDRTVQKLVLLVALVCCLAVNAAPAKTASAAKTSFIVSEECEKRVPSSYNAAQKKQLCSFDASAKTFGRIGPAICASVAKQMLHGNVKFETILQLCQGATSAAPVQCYDKMDSAGNQMKAKFGLELCARSDSTLPGECFAELSSYPGTANRLKPEAIMEFCKSLHDRAPLLCLQAVQETHILTVPQAIEVCGEVVGSGDHTSSVQNMAVATCIREMQSQVRDCD